jgi:hypothetical protein
VALGATAMPFLIHAMYGGRQPDPSTYTVPFQGRVVSEETGEPVVGICVMHNRYSNASTATDSDGRFLLYVPEEDFYSFRFEDFDGFENGGFFPYKYMRVTKEEIGESLNVSLHRESKTAVIRGTVRSKGIIGKPISGIVVSVSYVGASSSPEYAPFHSGFETLSDKKGKFHVQVPERDTYYVEFLDEGGSFQRETIHITSDEIKRSLKVKLEKRR